MATLELKLERTSFVNAVSKTQGVLDRKSAANVLSHILLESHDGSVRLMGTDYDVTIQADVGCEVLVAGGACINGKSLFDVLKNVDDKELQLRALDNHWIELTAGRSRFKLAGVSPTEFPDLSLPTDAQWRAIPTATLKDLIEKTEFSVSNDETRLNINGVFLKMQPADDGLCRLTMVSTDGHRLSRVELDADVGGYEGEERSAIIHKKGVQELRRLLDTDDDVVRVGFAKGNILFQASGTIFTVRQIEDTYPDYQRVIPKSSPVAIKIDRARFIRAVRRNAVLTSNKTFIIKVEIQTGKLAVTASNPDYGEGRDELDIEYEGDGMVIGFNYSYLLDVLNAIRGEFIQLEFNDEFSPTVITSPSEPGAIFVVMPMRV